MAGRAGSPITLIASSSASPGMISVASLAGSFASLDPSGSLAIPTLHLIGRPLGHLFVVHWHPLNNLRNLAQTTRMDYIAQPHRIKTGQKCFLAPP